MSWSCCWWPVYGLQLCEYPVWTLFNKYILTLLHHHTLELVSGMITAAALSAFLSWLGHLLSAPAELSLVYLGLLAYALGHAVCGVFYYTHCVQHPPTVPLRLVWINVLSVAGYTGVSLGLYVFSFFLDFPWQSTSSSLWALIVFPAFLCGVVADHSGTPVVLPMRRPFNESEQERQLQQQIEHVGSVVREVQDRSGALSPIRGAAEQYGKRLPPDDEEVEFNAADVESL